jgi:hypothetical protein
MMETGKEWIIAAAKAAVAMGRLNRRSYRNTE